MKPADLKELSLSDLQDQLAEAKEGLDKGKFSHAVSGLENPMVLRNSKKDIARLLTEINARKNAAKTAE